MENKWIYSFIPNSQEWVVNIQNKQKMTVRKFGNWRLDFGSFRMNKAVE